MTPELDTLGDQIFTTVNENQCIDLQKLFDYWHNPKIQAEGDIRAMHLELLELVAETGFLKQVETARKGLVEEHPELAAVPTDPEDILPSIY